MQVNQDAFRRQVAIANTLERDRMPYWQHWRDLADYFLPRRYPWLLSQPETQQITDWRNRKLLDSTSVYALRTLSAGMMNGITSPSRPWFRFGVDGIPEDELDYDTKLWLEISSKRTMGILSRSNFYSAMGVLYLEWPCFGTASMGIFEDDFDLIRCYNFGLGEFYIGNDGTGRITRHYRKFRRTLEQIVQSFGIENVGAELAEKYRRGGAEILASYTICHIVTSTEQDNLTQDKNTKWQTIYYRDGVQTGEVLSARPLEEWPFITPRWDVYANNAYGTSPAMDVLGDVIALQHMQKRLAQGIDKTVDPPMLVNAMLADKVSAMHAGERTYVMGRDLEAGARPVYQIQVPFNELGVRIQDRQAIIERGLYNDLFRMISQLQTVRSATEVEYRREEKLVLIGPTLQRFETEAVDPALRRVFSICLRRGVFPPLPNALRGRRLGIHYISVLSDAQRAVGTLATERWLQFMGFTAQIDPTVIDLVDMEKMGRRYGEDIGVSNTILRSPEEFAAMQDARRQQNSVENTAEVAKVGADAAKSLSQADVGGGQNVLSQILSMSN